MLLLASDLNEASRGEIEWYSSWLLSIGDCLAGTCKQTECNMRRVLIPAGFLLDYYQVGLSKLISFV